MPSERPSTVTTDPAPAPLFSPSRRWKKPSSGPHPRTGGGNHRGPQLSPLRPHLSRSELKRTLRESAETARLILDLNAAKASRRSDVSVRPDGGDGDAERLIPVRVALDVGHGAAQSLWSDADEVKLLAAAADFRERTGRPPLRLDTGALFDSTRDSVSPHIHEAEAYDKLTRFESNFMRGELASSAGTNDRRAHDQFTKVWGALDVVPLSEDDSDGQGAGGSYGDGRRLIAERVSIPAPSPRLDALMPYETPCASAMDADAAPAASSPSRSKKRPSRTGDGNSIPNSSSRGSLALTSEVKRRPRTSAESTTLTLATIAARASAVYVRSGAVQRRRRSGARAEGGDGAIRMLGAAVARVGGGRGGAQKQWSDDDELTLLTAAVAFRERNGRAPRLPDMAELFQSIRNSISPHIDQSMAYYKIKRLKNKFQHSDGPRDRRLRNLCSVLWGVGVVPSSEEDSDAGEQRVVPDAAAMMPVVTAVLGGYWKTHERAMSLSGVSLEKGLSLLRKKKGRLIETKWKQQLDEELQSQMRRYDLVKEVCGLLTDAIEGLSP